VEFLHHVGPEISGNHMLRRPKHSKIEAVAPEGGGGGGGGEEGRGKRGGEIKITFYY